MAIVKQYGLKGIGNDVQFGKGNGRLIFNGTDSAFDFRNLANDDYLNIRVAEPVQSSDAATKNYVDAVKTGLDVKDSVRVATTSTDGNIDLATGGLLTVDSVTLSAGDRVLVKDQTDGSQNGIYVVAAGAWVRSADADNNPNGEVSGGMFTFIEEGSVNADAGFVLGNITGVANLGVDSLQFVQFSGAGSIQAGDGLTKTGNTVDVNPDGTTVSVINDEVVVVSSATQYQTLISSGSGAATWGAVSLDQSAATSGLLRRDRGGLNADVSLYANDSLYVSNGTSTKELAAGAAYQSLTIDGAGVLAYGPVHIDQTGISVVGVLDETNGGTGESSYTQYDLLVGDASNGLSKFSKGANHEVLRVNGSGALEYGAVNLSQTETAVTGVLDETNGGTGNSSYVTGDLLLGTGVNTLGKLTVSTTADDVLISNGTTVVYAEAAGLTNVQGSRTQSVALATTNVGIALPAGINVTSITVHVTTAYNSGATMDIGRSGATDELASNDELDLQTAGIYRIDLRQSYASATQAVATLAGATSGACTIVLDYSVA